MRNKTKVWLITAAALIIIGCIIFVGVMSALKWDFSKLSTYSYETNTYEITEPFTDISLTTDTADIAFLLSDDGKCRIECYEDENAKHSVTTEDEKLIIESDSQKAWYEYIGFTFTSPKITVYLPKMEYNVLSIRESTGNIKIPKDFSFESAEISSSTGDIGFYASVSGSAKIKASTGNIGVKNISAEKLDLSVTTGQVTVTGVTCQDDITVGVSTGKVCLTDIACKSLVSTGTTGDISFNNVIAKERLHAERSTGNVSFNASDAAEVFVRTNTGNVTGSFITDKVFITDTGTGRVDVPKRSAGGKCEIKTDTGDIKIKIK